jgi:site-specific recombinase XerD
MKLRKLTLKLTKLKERWLATFNSNITRINYKHNVEVFLSWLNGKSIIDFRAIDANDYLQFLKNSKLNAGTIRFRIAAASSFCNYLKRADVVQTNYFQKINGLPKVKEKQKHIPSEKEIQVIKKELYQELNATGRGSSGKKQSAVIMILCFILYC